MHSDLQVEGQESAIPHGPPDRLGHWDAGACKDPATTSPAAEGHSQGSPVVFNGVKSSWFVYFSFNLGHFVSLSENVT